MSETNATETPKKALNLKRLPRVNPYELTILGFDNHPGVAADSKDENIRKVYTQLFDERAQMPLIPERLAMTRQQGISDPVLVFGFRGHHFVADGRRRVLYARKVWDEQSQAGMKEEDRITVPVIPFEGDVRTLFAQTRTMNVNEASTPMMRAREMNRLALEDLTGDDGKYRKRTVKEVAAIFGCSDQHVRDMQKLFESSDTVKKALSELKQPTIGLLLTGLPEEQQMEVLAELKTEQARGGKVTVRGAKKKVAAKKGQTGTTATDRVEKVEGIFTRFAKSVGAGGTKEQLLEFIDELARATFVRQVKFPAPIKDQTPGYTLAALVAPKEVK